VARGLAATDASENGSDREPDAADSDPSPAISFSVEACVEADRQRGDTNPAADEDTHDDTADATRGFAAVPESSICGGRARRRSTARWSSRSGLCRHGDDLSVGQSKTRHRVRVTVPQGELGLASGRACDVEDLKVTAWEAYVELVLVNEEGARHSREMNDALRSIGAKHGELSMRTRTYVAVIAMGDREVARREG
jgi:hypothetical protein